MTVMGPYADAALAYWAAGWRGVLPLPADRKDPPPHGYTGARGAWPSGADVYAWTEGPEGAGNIALRLPSHVVGIDVDAYSGKQGRETLHAAQTRWGPLPETVVSSARETPSGIYLYRVPDDLRWPGEVGPGVEIVQRRHRYMVAPPSVHPTGTRYLWRDGGAGDIPNVDDLPELPEAWVVGLTGGTYAVDIDKAELHAGDVGRWLSQIRAGDMCGQVRAAVLRATEDLRSALSSRHDTVTRGVMRLVHLGAEGHHGVGSALSVVHAVFLGAATAGVGARSTEGAEAEWSRVLTGAVAVVLAEPQELPAEDPCANPLGIPAQRLSGPPAPLAATAPPSSTPVDLDGDSGPPTGGDEPAAMTERDVYVAQEVFRLEVREDAKRIVAARRLQATWREPVSPGDLDDFLKVPKVEQPFLVAEVFPEGHNVVITAQFKTGKTTLVNHVAKCLADGDAFLGRYAVKPDAGAVAIWNYEVSENQYREWLRDAAFRNGRYVFPLTLRGFTMPLVVEDIQRWAVEWLKSREIRTWIVDPLARALSGVDENSNADVGQWLEVFDVIKERAGVQNMIVPTHTGRSEQVVGQERARGATRLDDWADTRWLLTKDAEGTRYFRASGRDVETEEAALSYDPLTRALLLTDGQRPPRQSAHPAHIPDAQIADLVMQAVMAVPGASVRGIVDFVRDRHPVRTQRVTEAIAALKSQNRIMDISTTARETALYLPSVARAMAASGRPLGGVSR